MSITQTTGYQNRTFFFIPIQLESFDGFTTQLDRNPEWEEIGADEVKPSYMLPYVTAIAGARDLFRSYRLKEPDQDGIYMFNTAADGSSGFAGSVELVEIRLSCFSTHIAFLEYVISYGADCEKARDSIMSFPYLFKRAKTKKEWDLCGKRSLYDYSESILPAGSGAKLFFTSGADFKCECKCFHTLKLTEKPDDEHKLPDMLHRLARSYNERFVGSVDACSKDMLYTPYDYSYWSGSPEGLANVVIESGNPKFINGFMYSQILVDYHFMYLILLNQRFSLLSYIDRVARVSGKEKGARKALTEINAESMRFKARLSFRVISDDLLFQTIYSNMYEILGIEELIKDTVENENQALSLLEQDNEKRETLVSHLLIGLSLLSLFSALADASGFFDRLPIRPGLSTWLSVGLVAAIIAGCLIWHFRDQRK